MHILLEPLIQTLIKLNRDRSVRWRWISTYNCYRFKLIADLKSFFFLERENLTSSSLNDENYDMKLCLYVSKLWVLSW